MVALAAGANLEELVGQIERHQPELVSVGDAQRADELSQLLEEKGILERRDFGGGRARYEPTEHGHHYHLIDVDSGKVIEFQDPAHERLMQKTAERLGFELVSLRLELFGRRVAQDDKRERPTPSRAQRAAVEGAETDPRHDRTSRWVPR